MALREKLSISLDSEVVRQIREEAGGNVSEWLNVAALLRLQSATLGRLLSAHGVTLTPELLAEVDAEWPNRG